MYTFYSDESGKPVLKFYNKDPETQKLEMLYSVDGATWELVTRLIESYTDDTDFLLSEAMDHGKLIQLYETGEWRVL